MPNDGWLSLLRVKQGAKATACRASTWHAAAVTAALLRRAVPRRPQRFGARRSAGVGLALDGPSVIEAFVATDEYTTTVYTKP